MDVFIFDSGMLWSSPSRLRLDLPSNQMVTPAILLVPSYGILRTPCRPTVVHDASSSC